MFEEEIQRLRQRGLFRLIKDREPIELSGQSASDYSFFASRIQLKGIKYLNFSSNDYLGLSVSRRISDASKKAMDAYGFGAGASRLLSGGTALHAELEKKVAEFKETEASIIFNSGYSANTSVIPAIAGDLDVIFSDELNHASIIDGCRLSRAKKVVYRHRDAGHLRELIKKEKGDKKIVITDSVFSMDGDIAPLKDIYDICGSINSEGGRLNSVILYIDDAHGTGVLGNGFGALKHFNIKAEPWIVQMGTFSKALGSYGAFVAASREIIDWLINSSRGFVFSTALPACIIAASIEALEIVRNEPALTERLWDNRQRLYNGILDQGFETFGSETPIIPLSPFNKSLSTSPTDKYADAETMLKLSEYLLENQIYAPAIRPPTVKEPRIRLTVSSAHNKEDIELLINALKAYRKAG